MKHDLDFEDFVVYFETTWNKQIKITKITDYEDNVIEKSDRELDRIFKQILNHCEYNDWFGEREKFTYVDEWFQQNIDFDKARGII
jgi:hypothetical protein